MFHFQLVLPCMISVPQQAASHHVCVWCPCMPWCTVHHNHTHFWLNETCWLDNLALAKRAYLSGIFIFTNKYNAVMISCYKIHTTLSYHTSANTLHTNQVEVWTGSYETWDISCNSYLTNFLVTLILSVILILGLAQCQFRMKFIELRNWEKLRFQFQNWIYVSTNI